MEAMFRATFTNGDAAYSITSLEEGRFVHINQAFEKLYGFSEGEIIGRTAVELGLYSKPSDRAKVLAELKAKGRITDFEALGRRKGGQEFHASFSFTQFVLDGRPHIVSTIRDITERKRTENALRKSEEKFAALFRRCPASITVSDLNDGDRFIEVNEAFESFTGYPREAVIGRTYPPDWLWADAMEYAQAVSQPTERGSLSNFEFRFRRKGGEIRNGLLSVEVQEIDGKPCLVATTIDITERRQAEGALRESEARLSEAARLADVGFSSWEVEADSTTWSEQMYKIVGWDRMVAPPSRAEHSKICSPESWVRMNDALTRVVEFGETVDLELDIVRSDGAPRYATKRLGPAARDPLGQVTRVYGTLHDITERKLAEDRLKEIQTNEAQLILARDRAQAANKAKSVFLANMSHELRTPLNAILGISNLLRGHATSEEQRTQLDIITNSGESLLSLINDMLDVARIEAGKQQLAIAPCALNVLVHDVVEMMRGRAEALGLELLLLKSPGAAPHVLTDASKLRQVLINLLGNAIKFTNSGAVTLRLNATAADLSGRLRLSVEVADTGIGISAQDQLRIFEPFVQATESPVPHGTGLGLTITRQFVEMMGGTIRLESALGQGSRFIVEVPVEIAQGSDLAIALPHRHHRFALEPDQPEYRVLIVEDNPENALLLDEMLKRAGFLTRVAQDGARGIEEFRSWRPNFIWMDVHMPGMGGPEATRLIRSMEGGQEVKIAAISASVFASARDEVLAAGMDDFVPKPNHPQEIFACMGRHLGVRYLQMEAARSPREQEDELRPESVAALSESLRRELALAVISLNPGRILDAIDRVGEAHPDVARILKHMAKRYAYTGILDAMEV